MLKQAGYSGDEIYQGPLLEHGFILEQDVADLVMPSTIYASDIFEALDSMSALKKSWRSALFLLLATVLIKEKLP